MILVLLKLSIGILLLYFKNKGYFLISEIILIHIK